MPNITVYNLYSGPLTLPGGHYTSAVPVSGNVTFAVPDVDEYVEEARFAALVASGYVRWEASAAGMAFNYQQVSWGGGGVSTTATVKGIAATDLILATVNASTNPSYIVSAIRTAVDTVTITFSADPGGSTKVALLVMRP